MKKLLFGAAFSVAIITAFATNTSSKKMTPTITAYETPGCSNTAEVNCVTSMNQNCVLNGKTYKLRDSEDHCTVSLSFN